MHPPGPGEQPVGASRRHYLQVGNPTPREGLPTQDLVGVASLMLLRSLVPVQRPSTLDELLTLVPSELCSELPEPGAKFLLLVFVWTLVLTGIETHWLNVPVGIVTRLANSSRPTLPVLRGLCNNILGTKQKSFHALIWPNSSFANLARCHGNTSQQLLLKVHCVQLCPPLRHGNGVWWCCCCCCGRTSKWHS